MRQIIIFSLAAYALSSGTDDILQYDDGIIEWGCIEGTYRGTWFDINDFYRTDNDGFSVEYAEVWFFHLSTYPWDTSWFFGELWDGFGPDILLDQQMGTASHMIPTYFYYTPPCTTGVHFWFIENTEISILGCPSIATDGSPAAPPHSFFSVGGALGSLEFRFLNQNKWSACNKPLAVPNNLGRLDEVILIMIGS